MVRPNEPPDVPLPEFDREDLETVREMIAAHRSRKAVHEKLLTWGKALLVASGVLLAVSQFREYIKAWLGLVK